MPDLTSILPLLTLVSSAIVPVEPPVAAAVAASAMAWYVPILIFLARICDVSIGTVRSMLVVAGYQIVPAIMGFFEVLIWVLAVGSAIRYLDNPWALMGYAGGYATGVILGVKCEERLALGYRILRIISIDKNIELATALRTAGYRVTRVEGEGRDGKVEVDFLVVKRRQVSEIRALVRQIAPRAFITVERVDHASGGGFTREASLGKRMVDRFFPLRK
ncbi:MAG: DUF2179 domain-containing protein [Phycisphaeraceae bacterium]|nr:MAG: DUF2179 domain-containing protein [Phycisphaeraceae bacterium]